MAFTLLPVVTPGSSTISKANMVTYFYDNIEFLRRRPTYRAFSAEEPTDLTNDTSDIYIKVETAVDGTPDRHEDWDTDDVLANTALNVAPETYPLASTKEGVWLIGAGFGIEANGTGSRRLYHRAFDGAAASTLLLILRHKASSVVRTYWSHSTFWNFATAGDDIIKYTAHQNSGSDLLVESAAEGTSTPFHLWGMWFADTSAGSTTDFVGTGFTSSDTVADWWNRARLDFQRLYHRPTCAMRSGTTTALTAGAYTQVDMSTEDIDTASMGSTASDLIVVQEPGYYYVTGGVFISSGVTSSTHLTARFFVNGVGRGPRSTYPGPATTVEGGAFHEGIVYAEDGDTIDLRCFTDTSSLTVAAGAASHLRATLVCGDTSPAGRQRFTDGLPATPNINDLDTTILPRGLVNVYRDFMAHLWQPPLLQVDVSGTPTVGEGWQQIPFNEYIGDPWGLHTGTDPSGKIVLPIDGTYLVVANASMGFRSEAGTDIGSTGDRGLRIAHNGEVRTKQVYPAPPSATTNSNLSTSILIVGTAGDEITADVWNGSGDNLLLNTGARNVLTIVWVGDGVTYNRP